MIPPEDSTQSGGRSARRASLRWRLTGSFAITAGLILIAFLPFASGLIRKQMRTDMDRQLRIDWALIEAHLEADDRGGVRWRASSPATPRSAGYAESWFDVWGGGVCLLQHWPGHGAGALGPPAPQGGAQARFDSVALSDGRPARTFRQSAKIDDRDVILRVFRDESAHRATQRRIMAGLSLGIPLAVLAAAFAGFAMAGRALRPLADMASAARRISSDSLGSRLPNPNPHDELGQLASVFNDTLHRLEGSFEALKRFTSDASHELRTPLAALRSVGEIALREPLGPEQLRETIGSMLEEAQRLHDLAETLLLLARAESGRMPLQVEDVDFEKLARDIVERLDVLASEKGQRLEMAISGRQTILRTDPVLLRQAVMNLVHNAIRHSPGSTTIRLRLGSGDGWVFLEIIDQGPGIPPEHRERIFDRFHRIDKARSRADGGTGLGLAIARLFVDQLGGRIELECPASGGSCFRVVMPVS